MIDIEQHYQQLCNTPSDINFHLPKLRQYADYCDTVVEFGVRGCVSTYAFLASNCNKLTSYDILDVAVPKHDKLTFICANDLEIEIEQCDMLFIDTAHLYLQLKSELAMHHKKVNKYIAFHDTEMFGLHSEDGSSPGLMKAINEFLLENREWRIEYSTPVNNGLLIIKRVI